MFGLDKVNEIFRGGRNEDPAAKTQAELARYEAAADEIRLYKTHEGRPLEDPKRAMENTNKEIQRLRLELEKMKPPVLQPSMQGSPEYKRPFTVEQPQITPREIPQQPPQAVPEHEEVA